MSKQRRTICLVSQEYPPETGGGGIGTQTFLKAHGLADLGHTVHVVSSANSHSGRTYSDGNVVVHRIPYADPNTPFSETSVHWVAYSLAVAKKIYELSKDIRFDLIQFPEYGAEGFIYQLDSCHSIPVVVGLHGSLAMFAERTGWPETDTDFYRFGMFMEQTVVRKADLLFADSHNIARFWADRYGIPLENIVVIHTAVDASLFSPATAKQAGRPTVLFVGRIDEEKGVFAVAEAVLRLKDKYPNVLFRIVGGGEPENVRLLNEKINAGGAKQNVELVGYEPYNQLARYYAECDVFAAPAPKEHGLATVYLEALSCGVPVVASTTGGAPEAVIDGQTGFLVPPGDLDALIRALDRLLEDPELRGRFGRNGRDMILNYFTVDKQALRVEAAYNRLLEKWNSASRARSSR